MQQCSQRRVPVAVCYISGPFRKAHECSVAPVQYEKNVFGMWLGSHSNFQVECEVVHWVDVESTKYLEQQEGAEEGGEVKHNKATRTWPGTRTMETLDPALKIAKPFLVRTCATEPDMGPVMVARELWQHQHCAVRRAVVRGDRVGCKDMEALYLGTDLSLIKRVQ